MSDLFSLKLAVDSPLSQEMKSHVLERIAKQVELASQDPPDIENMSAADLER